jgi:L-ascorbate metabolism protein UlaG (beta-lactamase superfamily)
MAVEVTWLGHATWLIDTGRRKLLVDPFLDDSPTAPVKSDQVEADYILVSHGHADHVADAAKIAKRTGATVISNFEICQWLARQGVKNTIGHNLGGGSSHDFGRVQLTLAHHSSQLPDGSYGGNPSGFLLWLADGGPNIYFACDTGLFYDMKLIGSVGLDLAVLPIGDLFTMGPEDALQAVKLLQPKRVVPSHFNTWPPIEQDAHAWAERVKQEARTDVTVLKPGEKLTV